MTISPAAPLLLALLGVLAGTGTSPVLAAPLTDRVFHRVGTDDPSTLDPHRMAFPGEQLVVLDLFMGLTTPDMRGRPMAGSAESWTVSPDGKVYQFRLREGLAWSDGRALSGEDFVWSFRRMLDPKTGYPFASRLYPVRGARDVAAGRAPIESLGVSAPDARTVRIELEGPTPYFLDVIAAAAMPVPRHVIEKHGNAWLRPENFVGNGPFVLAEWRPNAFVRLSRNPRFWGSSRVRLDGVVHYPFNNPMTMVRRFQAGELDLVMVVPPERADPRNNEFGRALKVGRGISSEVIVFNTRSGPTADVRVRRALSMLIEREAIARGVIGFPGVEAYSYVPPGVLNYESAARADFAAWPAERRVAEARRLLAAAGFNASRPLTLRLGFPTTELNRKVAVAVAAMWSRIGVKVDLQQKETKSLVAEVGRGDFDAVRFVWLAAFSDPYSYLERMLSSGSGVGINASGYANARFDERLLAASREVDVKRRSAILREAETLALADQPVAPIYYLVGRRLVSSRVEGFVDNPRGLYPTWLMSVRTR
ncbi:MAG: peptide ABC transporter substrate-binding protein [Steroidobacteraceae bacterium]